MFSDQTSAHYTRHNTIHSNTTAGRMFDAIPEANELNIHTSVASEKDKLFGILDRLRAESPDNYYGEIYSQVLEPGPVRANYISAALYTAHTPVDNRTRHALQLLLVRYIIHYGRDFQKFTLGEFSYALHERAFRQAGNRATIGLLPWAFLESFDATQFNAKSAGLPIGDWMINTAIEQLNPPSGKISKAGLLVRQYIDYTSQLWRPVLQEGWAFFD